MTDSAWKKTLLLFEETQSRALAMPPAAPSPSARFCRESVHRTLGHLTACQCSWIHLMRQLKAGEAKGSIPINPDPLYRKLSFGTQSWETLLQRFIADRAEWRALLAQIDVAQEIQTRKRIYTAQTLTKRMVDHEKRHLDDLL